MSLQSHPNAVDSMAGASTQEKKPTKQIVAEARALREAGDLGQARELLSRTLRTGAWTKGSLWWELVSLMASHENYEELRNLWHLAPGAVHRNNSIQRAVARAAAVAGEHHECRTLLRQLILRRAAERQAGLLDSLRRTVSGRSRRPQPAREPDGNSFSNRAAVALVDLNNAFSALGIKAFLISGTLLGHIREGGIIGWDKDIDVGIFSEDCTLDLETHFARHPLFRIGRVDLSSDRLRLIHANGMWIDVFPHYLEGGRRWHNGTATRWWNTPFGLRKIKFLGIDQYIPEDPERYLDENYGDWRTPNANFDARMDAPNAEVSDPEHFVSLLFFSLEKSIREGKLRMKSRYVEMLRAHGETAWLDRL